MIVLEFIFWISVFLILWTYLGYPFLLKVLDQKKSLTPALPDHLPTVDIIFAAYNEEVVIEDKIHSIYQSDYPLDKLNIYIGSDASTDRTDEIITKLSETYSNLHLVRMPGRTGKSGIINHLVSISKSDLILGTDANIYFDRGMITSMVKSISNPVVKLVGGNIVYRDSSVEGIAKQEEQYLNYENQIKLHESNLWGTAIGVEGGCYLIERDSFITIPPLTFMEDFFITMSVLQRGDKAVFDAKALCTEDVSVDRIEEFKRKVRISLGNFQNLRRFKGLIFSRFFPVGFAFLSHKVFRWFTPIFLIVSLLCSAVLAYQPGLNLYDLLFLGQLGLLLIVAIDLILPSTIERSSPIRFVGHFYLMNFALLKGLMIYLQGVESNVWQPTKRAQKRS
ncbi:glycosyltransferase [Phaeocystidibacter marisrubri]|uniref:Glycosyltransferase n=1 Tax=Phaeocystidibacter marisrubri TaxID=1577780 RepID=A0A6L3ZJ00_9FLAO|nr:glycosyltransferase [Phaeocystidibacter marisrubri]KAB2817861.1 glycosyltransferase [Phaeocystidibacter marisrubri]GGH73157.1 glycosyl transferase [Phaeocystidibacter marisrubri]